MKLRCVNEFSTAQSADCTAKNRWQWVWFFSSLILGWPLPFPRTTSFCVRSIRIAIAVADIRVVMCTRHRRFRARGSSAALSKCAHVPSTRRCLIEPSVRRRRQVGRLGERVQLYHRHTLPSVGCTHSLSRNGRKTNCYSTICDMCLHMSHIKTEARIACFIRPSKSAKKLDQTHTHTHTVHIRAVSHSITVRAIIRA